MISLETRISQMFSINKLANNHSSVFYPPLLALEGYLLFYPCNIVSIWIDSEVGPMLPRQIKNEIQEELTGCSPELQTALIMLQAV